MLNRLITTSALSLMAMACTVPQSTEIGGDEGNSSRKKTKPSPDFIQQEEVQTVSLPIKIEEESFRRNFEVASASTLTYRFSYLGKTKENAIQFVNNIATILLDGLPVNKVGNLTLEILENGSAKVRGSIENLTLQPGKNQRKITMRPVEGGNEQDLDIDDQNEEPGIFYAAHIKPIMDKHCVKCHSQNGSAKRNVLLDQGPFTIVNTTKFPNMAAMVDRIIDTVANSDSTMPMPMGPNPKLSADEIQTLKTWNDQGRKF